MKLLKPFAGLFTNPATGALSHSKLWANVAAALMTYKFATAAESAEWMWWCYGAMVGGYALIKRGIAAIPQVEQIRTEAKNDTAADTE